jgi:hypothetical protein
LRKIQNGELHNFHFSSDFVYFALIKEKFLGG